MTIEQMRAAANPARAFEDYAASNRDGAVELFGSIGGSVKLAEALGYDGKEAKSKARKFRKVIRTPDKDNPSRFAQEVRSDQDNVVDAIKVILQKNREKPHSIAELCERVDRGPSTVRAAIESLREQGIGVHLTEDDAVTIPLVAKSTPIELDFYGDEIRFGVISDTHYGSKYSAYEMVEAAYDYYAEEGIETVLHCGDLTEGPGERGYRGHSNDVLSSCHRWDGLEDYVSENYPYRAGVKTYFISSSKSHCGWEWNASGRDICSDIADGRKGVRERTESSFGWQDLDIIKELPPRDDMIYLGQDKAQLTMGPDENVSVRLFHPDGGSAFTISYKPQKFVEAFVGGTKPDIFLIGHYHQFFYTRFRNVSVCCVPGCQWETPLFRRWGKEPVVGALVATVRVDARGSVRGMVVEDLIHYFEPDGVYA